MAISLEDNTPAPGYPVIKRQRIGEVTILAIIRTEQRDVMKPDGKGGSEPALKPNGKARQELVIHGLVLPGTDAQAGIGGETSTPQPGSRVRMILRGGGFGSWIEARKAHRNGQLQVGDVLLHVVTHAQAYDHQGAPHGAKITSQTTADAVPRGQTLGYYGSIELQVPNNADQWQSWAVGAAEEAYRADTAIALEDAQEYAEPAEAQAPAAPAAPAAPPWAAAATPPVPVAAPVAAPPAPTPAVPPGAPLPF